MLTYEDSFYEFRDDVSDVTASVRRDGSTGHRVFVPRERLLQFTYQNAHEQLLLPQSGPAQTAGVSS